MLSRIRKNDTVVVTTGKDRGKSGKVIRVLPDSNRAIVERLNIVKRHSKSTGNQGPQGIVEKEAPIHISNLMPYCEKCSRPVRITRKREENGKATRVCRTCGDQIDG